MKNLLKKDGFTLIELLVVILIIGILIAVSAPSFLGQTQKAHQSAAQQNMAVAYKAAAAYGVDNDPQGSFAGFTLSSANEPELVGKVTIVTATDDTLTVNDNEGNVCYTQSFGSSLSSTPGPGALSSAAGAC